MLINYLLVKFELSKTLKEKIMKVVILAGGLGTRLSEYTHSIPKPMISINNKPLIFHIMKHYAKYGLKNFT